MVHFISFGTAILGQ